MMSELKVRKSLWGCTRITWQPCRGHAPGPSQSILSPRQPRGAFKTAVADSWGYRITPSLHLRVLNYGRLPAGHTRAPTFLPQKALPHVNVWHLPRCLRILECSESHQTLAECLPETLVDICAGVSQLRAQPQQENSGEEFGGSDSVCVVCWGVGIAGQRAWRRGREDRMQGRTSHSPVATFKPDSRFNRTTCSLSVPHSHQPAGILLQPVLCPGQL